MYIVTTWFGTFLIGDDEKIHKSVLFPQSAEAIGKRLQAIANHEILSEEYQLIEGAQNIKDIVVSEKRLQGLFSGNVEVKTISVLPQPQEFGIDYGLLHEAALYRSREQLLGDITPDRHIIHAINAITELTQTSNLISERLNEWYGLHWPGFTRQISGGDYLKLIQELGTRDKILAETEDLDTKSPSQENLGGTLSTIDIKAIQGLAKILEEVNTEREQLERYVKERVEEIAPNAAKIAGPLITAKLIALTGGIKRLSHASASTIQLLGAEKALFRHLKDGSSPPKHGVIFQHPNLHGAPYWQRGKIARALATKISIAIRIDYFKGTYIGDELEKDLQKRINEIRTRFPSAPQKKKSAKSRSSTVKDSKYSKKHKKPKKRSKKSK
jgi:nucleolar protein 56